MDYEILENKYTSKETMTSRCLHGKVSVPISLEVFNSIQHINVNLNFLKYDQEKHVILERSNHEIY